MHWMNSLFLMLVSSACCCLTVFALNDLNHDNRKQMDTKNGTLDSLFSSGTFKSKKSTQIVVDRTRLNEGKQLQVNQHKNVDKQSRNTQYSVDDDLPVGAYLENKPKEAVERFSIDELVHETSSPSGLKHQTPENINKHQGRDFNQEKDKQLGDDNIKQSSVDVSDVDVGQTGRKTFQCLPCTCSSTAGRFINANCTSRHLLEFPLELPVETVVLNLSDNSLKYLNVSSLLLYQNLLNVTLTSNTNLTKIINGTLGNQTSNVRMLNFTSCAIKTIQDGSFDITPELTHLIISKNNLVELGKHVFIGLLKLEYLDLSFNNIHWIDIGSFNYLNGLVSLDLCWNKQLGYSEEKLPPLLFTNLKNLQKLLIHGNTVRLERSYPNKVLQMLVQLRDLSIDGLGNGTEFGSEMQSLKNLVSLEIRGNCRIQKITETFFENIPFLKSLVVTNCTYFVHVHPKAYTRLVHLEAIAIMYAPLYEIDNAFQDLRGLNNSRLKSITFNKLKKPKYHCKILSKENARYLKNIDVEYLDLSDNEIALLGNDFLKDLPKTLKKLILRKNKFTSGTLSMRNLAVLTGLTELDLSKQNMDDYFDTHYNNKDDSLRLPSYGSQVKEARNEFNTSKETDENVGMTLRRSNNLALDNNVIIANDLSRKKCSLYRIFDIPPKLETLKASHYIIFGMQILTHGLLKRNNSLTEVDFSNSFMTNWGRGRLPPRITTANLGYNYCNKITHCFFHANNSHLHLYLNNNFLAEDFADDVRGQIFSQLSKTVYLDISKNLIFKLPKQFFHGLRSLTHLNISDNRLSMLNVSLAHIKTLKYLDLSRNDIRWVDAETRSDLDVIAASQTNDVIKIDLTMNQLPCTCDGFELISWMATTNVRFHNKNQLMCYPDNKVAELIGDLEERRQQLQRLCISRPIYVIVSAAGLVVAMVTVTLGLMYRYRWKLRYLHNTAMAALFGFKPDVSPKSGCTFDAYFVYATETRHFVIETCMKELEMKRGHRLCVEDRDFLAGTYIVSNIVSAVRNSTKTVVVMTTDLFEDPYSEYSFKMAVMEELFKQRAVLHLLLYQPVPCDQMSHEQLEMMKRNSYIEYPPDEGADVRQKFWNELSQTIGHSGSDKSEPVLEIE